MKYLPQKGLQGCFGCVERMDAVGKPQEEKMRIIKAEVRPMSFADYRKVDACNWSSFKHAVKAASYAKFKRENPHSGSQEGRLVHAMALDPATVDADFCVSPFDSFRTKAAQEWRDAETREVVTQATMDHCRAVSDAVTGSGIGSLLLAGSRTELTIIAEVEVDGEPVACKCRLDIDTQRSIVADLKTTDALDAGEFMRGEVVKLHYLGQAAFYLDLAAAAGIAAESWVWLCANLKTLDVFAVEADNEDLALGRDIYRRALTNYVRAMRSGVWAGAEPSNRVVQARVPDWYRAKMQDMASNDGDAAEWED